MAKYEKKVPRVCAACGEDKPYQNQPDPCLGRLPGVTNACCGHGLRNQCYVVEEDDIRIVHRVRDEAFARLVKLGGCPMPFMDPGPATGENLLEMTWPAKPPQEDQ